MVGQLTTHVLDIAHGLPAEGMKIELWRLEEGGEKKHLKTVLTNTDGRTNAPLLQDEELKRGVYELVFFVGDYFGEFSENSPDPVFLDQVPIRFGVSDIAAHYHVPLLTAPWSYSTYRGS
ncbi:hydroxyisourate hydrolase [Spirulina subsalsa FACHB-351]|uniref:5-hydroxyisourate hydrolase n=1 Tax=Spirulina subsalsa FACHB-351 TaxID=234711 RepID=A0ABT3L3F2_9CYAN|nr:hydroxyisourate hydrolase [Spirulina subsalsa]MCW6036043.1 hydroxyisourate hydrolase [Spirulina subsalsa FACHB-351]